MDEARLRAAFDAGVRDLPPPRARFATAGPEPRSAAVVVPISYDADGAATIHAVVRASTLRDHAGEVGFPGGKREPEDHDLAATAVREACEELGFVADELELLGALSPMPVITGRFWVHPYVALLRAGVTPRIVSTEIARLVEIPIAPWLRGERLIAVVDTTWRDVPMRVPHFELVDVEGAACVMYGASACTLYEALERIAASLGTSLPAPRITTQLPWGDRYRQFE